METNQSVNSIIDSDLEILEMDLSKKNSSDRESDLMTSGGQKSADTESGDPSTENMTYRAKLRDRKRIVVKVGSSSLLHSSTGRLDYHKIDVLVRELSDLKNRGKDVILVSSGATAVGREVIRRTHAGATLAEDSPITVKQACSAVGQARLMMTYQRFFTDYNQISGQVLMTKTLQHLQ